LESFWAQWIYGAGCPRFRVVQRFNKKRLCIEMTLRQIHDEEPIKRPLSRDEFLRLVREAANGDVVCGGPQHLFTGPMTIRIHEADGTPYEHIVEIREDAMRQAKFEIPYNTKYKRLKRTRRQKERANAGVNVDANGEHIEDALLYCLGDVLQGPDEMAAWELHDWDAEVEKRMDQESYEWIRMDADFEWLCTMSTNLESYMYVSQLQQDRDVAAQQDAMMFLTTGPRHPLVSTILTRTLVDRRYFHGIRTMAADMLPRHANIEALPLLGFRHLIKAYSELFCYPGTQTPRPNDFSDKKQYVVQGAIIRAIARVRDADGRCPEEGRRFILNQLTMNNNDDNPYSDHYYVATLIEALATSLIPDRHKNESSAFSSFEAASAGPVGMNMGFDDAGDDDDDAMELDFVGATASLARAHAERKDPLLESALELIDRYRRRDEWEQSYGNIWTVAALDAKLRLMKAGVVPVNGVDFLQYMLDGTHDNVRIKAFEAIVDLGLFLDIRVFRFFMCLVSTDRSPYARDRFLKALVAGFASLAFGDLPDTSAKAQQLPDSDDLVIMDSAQTVEERRAGHERRENLSAALHALKREVNTRMADDKVHLQAAMGSAIDSGVLGRKEVQVLLEVCAILFDEADRFIITLNYPKRWKVERRPPFKVGQVSCGGAGSILDMRASRASTPSESSHGETSKDWETSPETQDPSVVGARPVTTEEPPLGVSARRITPQEPHDPPLTHNAASLSDPSPEARCVGSDLEVRQGAAPPPPPQPIPGPGTPSCSISREQPNKEPVAWFGPRHGRPEEVSWAPRSLVGDRARSRSPGRPPRSVLGAESPASQATPAVPSSSGGTSPFFRARPRNEDPKSPKPSRPSGSPFFAGGRRPSRD
jgi:transcription initiation factor TFIID subunit 2